VKTISNKKVLKTKKRETENQTFNNLVAVIETEFRFSEALAIRKNEPSDYLRLAWQRTSTQYPPNLYNTPPTIFKTLGNFSATDQLAGLAKSGIRVALIGSGDEIPIGYNTSSNGPFVIDWFISNGKFIPTPNMFQLLARTTQQMVDLSLIARYIAEKSLCPGLVIYNQDLKNIKNEKVELLDVEKIRSFLGVPDDQIDTPSKIQKKYFGDKRRRIPDYSKLNVSINTEELIKEIPSFLGEALDKFAKLSGHSYRVLEQVKTDDADAAIVATGKNFNWLADNLAKLNKNLNSKIGLIYPTLVSPFPGDQISKLIKGKKKIILVSGYLTPEHDPVFLKLNELAKVVAFSASTGQIDFEKFQEALKQATDGSSKQFQFDVSVQKERIIVEQEQRPQNEEVETEMLLIEAEEQVIKEESPDETGIEILSGDNFRQLLSYFITGKVSDPDLQKNIGLNLKPARLSKPENILNHNFPVCLSHNNSEHLVKPIPKIIDEIINEEPEAEEGNDNFKSNLSLLKLKLGSLVNGKHKEKLSELWDRATDSILSEMKPDNGNKEEAEKNLQKAKTKLTVDGEVLSHDQSFPLIVIDGSVRKVWAEKIIYFSDLLELLITQLMGILGVDRSGKSSNGEDFGSSVASAFKDELDFDFFTDIVGESFKSKPLSKAKQLKIQNLLKDLRDMHGFYSTTEKSDLFKFHCDATNCAETIGQIQARIRKTTKFFRAYHIAKLEIENKYKEEKHDRFFNGYTSSHLTAEDLELTPPILLYVTSQFMDETQLAAITEILKTDLPIKIILLNNDVIDESGLLPDQPTWSTKFASMAIALNNVYVFQSAIADGELFANGIINGLKYNGPALFNIYTGGSQESFSSLPLELVSSLAVESRAFPTLIYDPAKSSDWGLRFNIHDNPQFENDWISEKFIYQDSGGNETSIDLAFTLVDFLAADSRFSDHFLYLPRSRWHENMVLVQDYLKLNAEESKYKLPYILMTGEDSTLFRVIPSSFIIRMALSWLDIWRSLQEIGLFKEERSRLDEQKRQEIEKVEQKYQKESGKSENELKKQIISNLLTRLLSGDLKSPIDVSAPAVPMDTTSGPAAETVEKPAAEVSEEKEEVSEIADPYIDTPLCTSCNECTNINSRMFAYNENKQAYIKDAKAGTFKELVKAAEKCPARIIHPGKPKNPNEPGLDKLIKRAEKFN
jgi:ferredoxin